MRKKNSFIIYIVTFFLMLTCAPPSAKAHASALPALSPDDLTAESAIVIDAKTGAVVFEKNSLEKYYPASITKIMTALLTLEYIQKSGDEAACLSERVYFSHEAVYSLPSDSSGIAMDEGESLSLEQALYAIMLPSANEVSNAVAEHIAGSFYDFTLMMNKRAKELGAADTNFKNPHGYHDDDHYTTARDISLIMRECVRHPFFVTLISTVKYEIPPTEKQSETRELFNTNRMIRESDYYNPDVVGGKTGFTTPAGHTLAAYSKKEAGPLFPGIELITVVLKSERNVMYEDTQALLDYGFKIYGDVKVLDKNNRAFNRAVPVKQKHGDSLIDLGSVNIAPSGDLFYFMPRNADLKNISLNVSLPEYLEPPITRGQTVGRVAVSLNGRALGAVALIAKTEAFPLETLGIESEEKSADRMESALEIFSHVRTTLYVFAAIVILLYSIRWINILRRRRRRAVRMIRF